MRGVLARVFQAVPLLGWGPIGFVLTHIAVHFADRLYDGVVLFINVELIAYRNQEFQKTFERASTSLKIIARDCGIESKEFQDQRESSRRVLENLVRLRIG